jgi:hypothetical protein
MIRTRIYAAPPPGCLWEADAALHIGTRPTTLRDWRTKELGAPPHIRIRSRAAYRVADLDAWLAARWTTDGSRGAAAQKAAPGSEAVTASS